jgi:hypothetical protein
MIEFKLDEIGKTSRLLSKSVSDQLFNFLNAIANGTVSPPGAGKILANENSFVIQINAGTGAGDTTCNLGAFDATAGGVWMVGFSFGTINNIAPAGMPGGNDPPFSIPVSGSGFLFAKAEFDLSTSQTTAASIITNPIALLKNTATVGYQCIGSYACKTDESGNKSVTVTPICGNVSIDVCALVANSGNSGGSGGSNGNGLGTGGGDDGDGLGTGGDGSDGLQTGSLETGSLETGSLQTGGLGGD